MVGDVLADVVHAGLDFVELVFDFEIAGFHLFNVRFDLIMVLLYCFQRGSSALVVTSHSGDTFVKDGFFLLDFLERW